MCSFPTIQPDSLLFAEFLELFKITPGFGTLKSKKVLCDIPFWFGVVILTTSTPFLALSRVA